MRSRKRSRLDLMLPLADCSHARIARASRVAPFRGWTLACRWRRVMVPSKHPASSTQLCSTLDGLM